MEEEGDNGDFIVSDHFVGTQLAAGEVVNALIPQAARLDAAMPNWHSVYDFPDLALKRVRIDAVRASMHLMIRRRREAQEKERDDKERDDTGADSCGSA